MIYQHEVFGKIGNFPALKAIMLTADHRPQTIVPKLSMGGLWSMFCGQQLFQVEI
jgi:hypothetical protein